MRVLGLDIGSVRIGAAVSDPSGTVATPLAVFDAKEFLRDPSALRAVVEEYGVGELVFGLPVTLGGDEGVQAREVRAAAETLGRALGLPIAFFDERLSSVEARAAMRAQGADERRQRGKLDMVAATLMLQAYLDAQRGVRCDES